MYEIVWVFCVECFVAFSVRRYLILCICDVCAYVDYCFRVFCAEWVVVEELFDYLHVCACIDFCVFCEGACCCVYDEELIDFGVCVCVHECRV